ncbi:MAG: SCO family protein [Deltaproteobacteria bacterium]|nr:SCO family protein [Deltaproteobacteria bacterium]
MSSPAATDAAPTAPGRAVVVAIVIGLVLAAGAGVALSMLAPPPGPRLEQLGALPAFELTDQTGKPFGLNELRGKVWIADFVFTRCPGVCPLLTERMGKIQARAGELGSDFQLVSVSVDPAFDTPERLTAYMAKHKADAANWHFLTGPTDAIQTVVTDGFKEVLERDHAKGPDDFMSIVHGGHFVVVDRQGHVRDYVDSGAPDAVDVALRDAKSLLREK